MSNLTGFFKLLADVVDRLGLRSKPQNIFNVDETNMSASSTNTRVFCEKGLNRINKVTGNNEKLNYTIQVSLNV